MGARLGRGWRRWAAVGWLACSLGVHAVESGAQTRFVGDSPTRLNANLGRSTGLVRTGLASTGLARSTTRVSTVVGVSPGGVLAYRSYGFYPYDPVFGYAGYYDPRLVPYAGGFPLGLCRRCGLYGAGCGCFGPVVLPPVVLDPGELYGPRALIRFLGAEAAFTKPVPRPRNAAPPAQPPAPAGIAAAPQPAGPPAVVPGGARARAWKFIDHGDRHFKAGRYRDALSRYKKATASAPDLAAARFREGFAYLGLGAVDRAALSIRRGLARDPAWPQSDFVLDDLFVDNDSRQAVQRTVAAELRDSPNNSEARLLAGVLLHFDGQPRAAEKQFRRVIAIAGQDAAAALFLPPPVDPPPANEEAR